MKILFYINVLGGGGAERVISVLANYFCESGCDVVLVNSYKLDNEYIINKNIKRYYTDQNEYATFVARNVMRICNLRRIVKHESPDVIISFMAESNLRMLISTVFMKTKRVISVRNDPSKEYSNPLIRKIAFFIFKLADGIIFQTQDAMRFFPENIRKKGIVIYNPIDEAFFDTYCVGRRDIVSVGRLTKQKNHALMINAFKMISDKTTENLYIYGDGDLRQELEEQINNCNLGNRVFIEGFSNNIISKIHDARLFVLSSDYEGMPNSLMEAMALGIPCISTDCPCGGPRELFDGSAGCMLVPIDDAEELAIGMLKMLHQDYVESSEAIHNHAKKFHPTLILQNWQHFIDEIVKNE